MFWEWRWIFLYQAHEERGERCNCSMRFKYLAVSRIRIKSCLIRSLDPNVTSSGSSLGWCPSALDSRLGGGQCDSMLQRTLSHTLLGPCTERKEFWNDLIFQHRWLK